MAKSGYKTLSKNIPEFAKINEMPIPLDIRRVDEGGGIEAALIKNEAKYHESCRLQFNNTKLQRAQKRHKSPDMTLSDEPSSSKFTRRSCNASTEEGPLHLEECFICEKKASRTELREAMTMQLNTRLYLCAKTLQDQKRLAKLSVGDVVAQELKYHGTCLTSLYNKERAHLRKQQLMSKVADSEIEINQIVFAELVTHIVESQRGNTGGLVFKLADLCHLYESRLKQFEANLTFNRTRLKNKLLSEIPELKAFQERFYWFWKKTLAPRLFLLVTILMPCISLKQVTLSVEKCLPSTQHFQVISTETISLILFHVVWLNLSQ